MNIGFDQVIYRFQETPGNRIFLNKKKKGESLVFVGGEGQENGYCKVKKMDIASTAPL